MASKQLSMLAGPQSPQCITTDKSAAALTSQLAVDRTAGQLRRQTVPGPLRHTLPISHIPRAVGGICAVRHCHATAETPLCCQALPRHS